MIYKTASLLVLLALPLSTLAHHSVSSTFDTNEIVETEGEITELIWRNPHVRFQLAVPGDGGSAEIWNIEMTSLTNLRRSGLTGQLMNVGDTIKVAGNPGRSSPTALYAENLLLANGEEVLLAGRAAPRWSTEALGRGGPSGSGDGSAPEIGIFRIWSTPPGQTLLFPEDVDSNFDFSTYPLTASARAAVEAFDPATDSPILDCVSKGMPTIMEQPYPMEFMRQDDDIILRMEEYDTLRMIHMDPDASDAGEPPAKLGYSTGRWEGRNLVVRTTRSDWAHFDVVGIPHSVDSEILERFTLSADGSRLDYSLTVTDPVNFTEPVTLTKYWVWYPEMTIEPFRCAI